MKHLIIITIAAFLSLSATAQTWVSEPISIIRNGSQIEVRVTEHQIFEIHFDTLNSNTGEWVHYYTSGWINTSGNPHTYQFNLDHWPYKSTQVTALILGKSYYWKQCRYFTNSKPGKYDFDYKGK